MPNHATALLRRIQSHDALIGIIGLGYVGLPLALTFTEKGFTVLGFDVDPDKVAKLARGESYIRHLDGGRIERMCASQLFSATTDFARLDEPDAILICVPTPLTPQREPDMTYVRRAAFQVAKGLRPGQLVILESTTYPGTTDELLLPILEGRDQRRDEDGEGARQSKPEETQPQRPDSSDDGAEGDASRDGRGGGFGMEPDTNHGWIPDLPDSDAPPGTAGPVATSRHPEERSDEGSPNSTTPVHGTPDSPGGRAGNSSLLCGTDYFVAFSPEREDPGNPNYGTTNTPKVLGGVDEVSGDLAQALYDQVISSTVRVSSARAAEASKLTENIFRAVNIALVNELKMAYDRMGIDIWEVLDAAETKPFGFMRFNPGPGFGGHCIPLDPFYLSWKAREYGVNTRFIELAGEVNVRMPEYVIEKLMLALNERGKAVKGSSVLVLGLAYKKDIDDPRESPAFEIIDLLLRLGAEVTYHDPHIPTAPAMRSWPDLPPMHSVDLTAERLQASDAVLIVTDHRAVDYELVVANAALVVDTRGVYRSRGRNIVKA